ncbi:MAG: hypothetical protein ABW082_08735 [Sedimenticola sp.]
MDTRYLIAAALLICQPLWAASECTEYADRLDACEPYECSFTHPFTGTPMKKSVIGPDDDGNCLTREQMPGNMTMECRFDEAYRKEVADYIRQVEAAEKSSTEARIAGGKTKVTTRLDGKAVANPLQAAMEKGLCKAIMPQGREKPRASSPPPAKPKRLHKPPQPPAPPAPPKRAVPKAKPGKQALPDLAVVRVEFDARCRPIVTLENRGGAGVPASAYDRSNSAGIQLYKEGKGWQGVALFGFDRTRALMKPGGQASFTLFQPLPEGTSARVKIVADLRNQIRESNKRNNTLELELRCR